MSYVAFNVMTYVFCCMFLLYFNVVTHVETLDSLESGKKIARIKVFQNHFIHSTAGLSHQFELYLHYFTFPPPGFWSSVYATNVCSVDSNYLVCKEFALSFHDIMALLAPSIEEHR